ncbi:MAG: 50S ribosomal protein L35ae [Nanoarchaeota archaeon]|nr:50S ribosomal protein L35ae [Nanoarchaeota archaeon]
MNAKIVSYRRGRHTQYKNQMLLRMDGVDSREKAEKLVGKKVGWTNTKGKIVKGEVTRVHGANGVFRALFDKGMPGQSIGTLVKIE